MHRVGGVQGQSGDEVEAMPSFPLAKKVPRHANGFARIGTCRLPDYAGLGPSSSRRGRHPNHHTEPFATGVCRILSNRLISPSVRSSAKLPFPGSTARGVLSAPNLVTPHALTAKLVVEALLLRLAARAEVSLLSLLICYSCLVALCPDMAGGHEAQQSLQVISTSPPVKP